MPERIFSKFENQKIDKSRVGENQTINGKTTEVIFFFFLSFQLITTCSFDVTGIVPSKIIVHAGSKAK